MLLWRIWMIPFLVGLITFLAYLVSAEFLKYLKQSK